VTRRRAFEALVVVAVLAASTVATLSFLHAAPRRASTSAPTSTGGPPGPSAVPTVGGTPEPRPGGNGLRSRPAGIYADDVSPQLSRRVADVPTRVYVPNNLSDTVDVINPRTYRVERVFHVGSGPQHITPSWNLRHLYVGNTYGNTLTVIDPRTGRPTRTISVPDPYNLYFTPDGTTAIDVAERLERLFFFDPRTWKLLGSLRVPYAGIDHLDFSADGRFLLLSAEFSGEIVRVDVARRRVTGHLHVGGSPVDVKLSPDGSVFFVANQVRNGVSVVDARRMREIAFVRTGAGAHGFCVSRDARDLYVSNRLAGSISVLSFATRRVVHTWHVGGSPDMMQVSADGRLLWASNRYDATVSVISTRTGHVAHTIPVGGGPHGLTLFPQPGRYSIGHNGVYR
jgi:YVTN family beta-propeller protein